MSVIDARDRFPKKPEDTEGWYVYEAEFLYKDEPVLFHFAARNNDEAIEILKAFRKTKQFILNKE